MEGQDGMNQYLADADGVSLAPTMCGMLTFGNAGMIAAYDAGGEVMADFWNPFAEPSTVPRTRYPQTLVAAFPDSINFASTSLTVTCPVEGALIGLYWENQTWAAARVQNGIAVLEFDPLYNTGEVVVTVTQFNYLPYQGKIQVKPSAQPFVVGRASSIEDAAGNNNQRADFGEQPTLRIPLQNVGLATAVDVQTTLDTDSPYVTLLDNSANAGDIAGGNTADVLFRFSVRNDVPNGAKAIFNLNVTYDGASAYTTSITVPLFAPALEIPSWTIETASLSNNRLVGGEVAVLRILNRNAGGSNLSAATGVLSSLSPYLNVSAPAALGLLAAGNGEQQTTFDVTVSPAAPVGALAYLNYKIEAGAYSTETVIGPFVINALVETFESNDFSAFDWETTGNSPWVITNDNPYFGKYCARSGNINHNQSTSMTLNLEVTDDGFVAFARRVSSEEGYDFLEFAIDNIPVGAWSGEVPWSEVSFPIEKGPHTLTWVYRKDDYVADGADRAWVDEIILPPHEIATNAPTPEAPVFGLSATPNPTSALLTLRLSMPTEQTISIRVLDQLGRLVQTAQPPTRLPAGSFARTFDLSALPPGVYLVQMQGEQAGETVKVVRY